MTDPKRPEGYEVDDPSKDDRASFVDHELRKQMDEAGVPEDGRASNAGGSMAPGNPSSHRSREKDRG